jgi:hypothetical protein
MIFSKEVIVIKIAPVQTRGAAVLNNHRACDSRESQNHGRILCFTTQVNYLQGRGNQKEN